LLTSGDRSYNRSMGSAAGQQQLLSDLVSHLLLAQVLGRQCMSRMLTL
jgi:hypothetical protein